MSRSTESSAISNAEQGVETGVVIRITAVAAGMIVLQHDPREPLRIEGVARLRMRAIARGFGKIEVEIGLAEFEGVHLRG